MKKPVENARAIILALLIAGCTSDMRGGPGNGSQSSRPAQASPPDVQDQRRQEEQRKQDLQQHEMERGELGTTRTVFSVTARPAPVRAGLPPPTYEASFSLLGTSNT
jgi:hypothetical protein